LPQEKKILVARRKVKKTIVLSLYKENISWHQKSRFVPIQTTTVPVEVTIFFVAFYFILVTITIFLSNCKKKLSCKNCYFEKVNFCVQVKRNVMLLVRSTYAQFTKALLT